jgi:hypothetical protein
VSKLPPLIEERVKGVTLFGNWMILMREDWEFFETVIGPSPPGTRRAFDCILTLNHEAVHFCQSYTEAFPYSYSIHWLQLCQSLMEHARKGLLNEKTLRSFQQTDYNYNNQLLNRKSGVSALDLLEAMAVTESFRATDPDPSVSRFLRYLYTYFPNHESRYRRAIDFVVHFLGPDAAFELTPRLCFFALNGDDPGRNFKSFIYQLTKENVAEPHRLKALDLCRIFGMPPDGFFLNRFKEVFDQGGRHKWLAPYMNGLLTLGSYSEIFESASQLGNWLRAGPPGANKYLVPPLVLLSGGRGKLLGLAKEWSFEKRFSYVDTAALEGVCERLLTKEKPYQCCPHKDCPVHKTALCHKWYAVPQQIPWTKCAFPKRLQIQFGMQPEELMRVRSLCFE